MIYLYGQPKSLDISLSFKYYLRERFGVNQLTFYPVYQLKPSKLIDEGELALLSDIYDAQKTVLPNGGFYLRPADGQMTPWGLKFTQMLQDLHIRTIGEVDRYFYLYLDGHQMDFYTQRLIMNIFLPEVYYRHKELVHGNASEKDEIEWLYVDDLIEDRSRRILNRYGMGQYHFSIEHMKQLIDVPRIMASTLLAFCHVNDWRSEVKKSGQTIYSDRDLLSIRPSNHHYIFLDEKHSLFSTGKSLEKVMLASAMKVAGYEFFEHSHGGKLDHFFLITQKKQDKKRSWSDFSQLAGYPVPFLRVIDVNKPSVAFAIGSQKKQETKVDVDHASILLVGISKMSRLRLMNDQDCRQDALLVDESHYLNPEVMRRLQAIFLRLSQMERPALVDVLNLTKTGLVFQMLKFAKMHKVGFNLDVDEIPKFSPQIRYEDVLYQPWNDAVVIIVSHSSLDKVIDILDREVCPYKLIGEISNDRRVHISSRKIDSVILDVSLEQLMSIDVQEEVVEDEEKQTAREPSNECSSTLQQELINWLYTEDFLDPMSNLSNLDMSCYGTLIMGMPVGPWQCAVNQVVVTQHDDVWKAGTMMCYHGTDLEHLIQMVAFRMLQVGLSLEELSLRLLIPPGVSAKAVQRFTSKFQDINMQWRFDNGVDDIIVVANGIIFDKSKPLLSPYFDGKEAGDLYVICANTSDLEAQSIVNKKIKQLYENGCFSSYVSIDQCLWGSLLRMSFASRVGWDIELPPEEKIQLTSPEIGTLVLISPDHVKECELLLQGDAVFFKIGTPNNSGNIALKHKGQDLKFSVSHLRKIWSKTYFDMLTVEARDKGEYFSVDQFVSQDHPGLRSQVLPKGLVKFQGDVTDLRIAIIRDRGSFGHFPIAKILVRMGICVTDVTYKDLIDGKETLRAFQGIIFPGGATYGDEGSGGQCTSKKVMAHPALCKEFEQFFLRADTLTLGFGNGGQIVSNLQSLMGDASWPIPKLSTDRSFHSRKTIFDVQKSPSVVLKELEGSALLCSYGGRFCHIDKVKDHNNVALSVTNPSGDSHISVETNAFYNDDGAYAFTNDSGRITWFLCHPEYHVDHGTYDYFGQYWKHEDSPWVQIFHSMIQWLIDNQVRSEDN